MIFVACGGESSSEMPGDGQTGPDATPPVPTGCVTDVVTGDHTYSCGGLAVDARIPAACQAAA